MLLNACGRQVKPRPTSGKTALTAEEAAGLFTVLADARHVLVAVSGGPDSVALLGLLAGWTGDGAGRPAISAATVDHGLRSAAAVEAAQVAALCRRLGVVHETLSWSGDKPVTGLQAAARRARYDLLGIHAAAIGADCLVTAHTLDDQAETVMMRLARGSGPAGLAGMRASVRRAGLGHWRPLLAIPKARLIATCTAMGLPFADDASNRDPRFTRSRWRVLMPLLAAEGLTAERLSRLASRAALLDQFVDAQAAAVLERAAIAGRPQFSATVIFAAPDALAVRVLARIVAAHADGDSARHLRLDRLEKLQSELFQACSTGARLRRSLAGVVVTLDRQGVISLSTEAPRRRGRSPQLRI